MSLVTQARSQDFCVGGRFRTKVGPFFRSRQPLVMPVEWCEGIMPPPYFAFPAFKHNFFSPLPYAKLNRLPLKVIMIMCHFEFMCIF